MLVVWEYAFVFAQNCGVCVYCVFLVRADTHPTQKRTHSHVWCRRARPTCHTLYMLWCVCMYSRVLDPRWMRWQGDVSVGWLVKQPAVASGSGDPSRAKCTHNFTHTHAQLAHSPATTGAKQSFNGRGRRKLSPAVWAMMLGRTDARAGRG